MLADVARIFIPATLSFFIGVVMTPFLTHYLYRKKMWKKKAGKVGLDGKGAEVFNALHLTKEVGTPRFGGVVVWGSVTLVTVLLGSLAPLGGIFETLNFLSRGQTWLPLATLLLGAFVGLIDDLWEVSEQAKRQGGLPMRIRLSVVGAVSLLCALWFYEKLDVASIAVPFFGPLELGVFFVPFFVFVALSMYAAGTIDGLDGLAGGVFASAFAAYAGIAFFGEQYDLAALCASITGALLAFLWFNIPPARFYLSETGTMGLTLALTVVAFLADTLGEGIGVLVLPLIGLPFVATVCSILLQLLWKRYFGRKLFRVAPLHHHFEAVGWPAHKVVMRYWVISVMCGIVGLTVALIG